MGRRIGRNMHPGVPRRIGRMVHDGIDRSLGHDSARFSEKPHLPMDKVKGMLGGIHPDHDLSHGWQGALDGALSKAAGFINSHPQVKSFVDAHKPQITSGIDNAISHVGSSSPALEALNKVKAKLGEV